MEDVKIREFLGSGSGYGSGFGDGFGYGDGSGHGSGHGFGSGDGHGSGSGDGHGSGSGSGSGSGYGDGSGSGSGDGSGYGYGYGSGYGSGYGYGSGDGDGSGSGIKSINGQTVYLIDGVQTIIDHIKGYIAKGRILMGDLTTRKCFVVKHNGLFAHGDTLREAQSALAEKLFDGMSEEERIEAFVSAHGADKKYPTADFFDWHNKLTGSCLAGRKAFAENHGVDLNGSMTVAQFIALTENDYGGAVIRKLRDKYKNHKIKEK